MEIHEYFKARWVALMIVAPLIAGVTATVLLADQIEPTYIARARVAVPQALSATSEDVMAESRGPARSDFRNALTSEATALLVAEELGIPVADVRGQIASTVVSSQVTGIDVTFKGETPEIARDGIDAAVQVSLQSIATSRLQISQRAAETVGAVAEGAEARLTALEEETQLYDVESEYRQRSGQVSSLEIQITTLLGDPTAELTDIAALQELLDQKIEERDAYGAVLNRHRSAVDALGTAQNAAYEAELELALAESVVESVASSNGVEAAQVSEVGTTKSLLLGGVLAAGLTFGIVLLLALLARWRRERRAKKKGASADEPLPPPPGDGGESAHQASFEKSLMDLDLELGLTPDDSTGDPSRV